MLQDFFAKNAFFENSHFKLGLVGKGTFRCPMIRFVHYFQVFHTLKLDSEGNPPYGISMNIFNYLI